MVLINKSVPACTTAKFLPPDCFVYSTCIKVNPTLAQTARPNSVITEKSPLNNSGTLKIII